MRSGQVPETLRPFHRLIARLCTIPQFNTSRVNLQSHRTVNFDETVSLLRSDPFALCQLSSTALRGTRCPSRDDGVAMTRWADHGRSMRCNTLLACLREDESSTLCCTLCAVLRSDFRLDIVHIDLFAFVPGPSTQGNYKQLRQMFTSGLQVGCICPVSVRKRRDSGT